MKTTRGGSSGGMKVARGILLVLLCASLAAWCALASGCGKKPKTTPRSTQPSTSPKADGGAGFIVFERDYRLMRVNEDGSSPVSLTSGYDTDPAVSADGGHIAYAHSETDPRSVTSTLTRTPPPVVSIYEADSDGKGPVRLTPQEWGTSTGWDPLVTRQPEGTAWIQRDCSQPSYSRDGSKLALVLRDHGFHESPSGGIGGFGLEAVATLGLTGADKGKLTIIARTEDAFGGGGFSSPRFSNDGDYIYFDEMGGGGPPGSAIVRVDSTGANKTVIANYAIGQAQGPDIGYYAFDVSPTDGSLAALEVSVGNGDMFAGKIVLMAPDGTNRRYVPTEGVYIGADNLCFSPDGGSLAFSTQEFGRQSFGAPSDVYRVKTSGEGLVKVVTDGRDAAWGAARKGE